jgi:hypothetical protein
MGIDEHGPSAMEHAPAEASRPDNWILTISLAIEAVDKVEAFRIADLVASVLEVPTKKWRESWRLRDESWVVQVAFDIPEGFKFDPDDAPTRIRYLSRNTLNIPWRVVKNEAESAIIEWPLPWWDRESSQEVLWHENVKGAAIRAFRILSDQDPAAPA